MTTKPTPESTETAPETETATTEITADERPEAEGGKLLLGKKVLRHFGVRSDVQAGGNSYTITRRCR